MLKYILVLAFVACVAAVDDDAHAHVKNEYKKDDGHGHFSYGFDATNGIGASETGDQKDVHGEYHYVSKDGVPVKVTYTADAQGYHPQGNVLPTAPPVPAAILKGLAYIKEHPHQDDKHDNSQHENANRQERAGHGHGHQSGHGHGHGHQSGHGHGHGHQSGHGHGHGSHGHHGHH